MFLISQMFFIQFWRLPAHFWMVQVIFRLSFSLNVPFPAQYPFVLYFYPTWSHVIMQLTAITYQFLFKATLPCLQMKEHPVVTPLLLHNNQEFFFSKIILKWHLILHTKHFLMIKVWLYPYPWCIKVIHKSPQITPECHIQVCRYKGGIILMNSEFTQLLNHRIQDLGWTFS